MTAYRKVLPWPDKRLHSNSRCHPLEKARAVREARGYAWAVAMQAPRIKCIPDATIVVEYFPPSRRGDIHNVPSSLKAYIDGIAEAMGCDDKDFRVKFPDEWAGVKKPGEVVFHISQPGQDQ